MGGSTVSAIRLVSGFGRAGSSAARVVHADGAALAGLVKDLPDRGGIARGLGRSYGDAAQNAGGHVLRLAPDPERMVVDVAAGTVTVGGGVSLADLIARIVPMGWFVPVTPGTRSVTVGGAIASDIHGKNHHVDGSFGQHVERIGLVLADTTTVDIGPDRDPELFWATVGGMGLTGVIADATIRLIPIETSRLSVDIRRLGHLDDVMSHMSATDASVRYSVAWIDLLASGARRGRGVVTNAEHAVVDQLDEAQRTQPLAYVTPESAAVPTPMPASGLINRVSVGAFNEMWFRRAPRRRDGVLQSIPTYFHPLDQLRNWNRVYGRGGFIQYQFVVPDDAGDALRAIVERVSAARLPIFLAVLKRFGPGNGAPLSFPMAGWTLAIDVGARVDDLAPLLRSLDDRVLGAGGRHYLAKDFHIGPEAVRRGYPDLPAWLDVRRRVDPTGLWMSDLGRRLHLDQVEA